MTELDVLNQKIKLAREAEGQQKRLDTALQTLQGEQRTLRDIKKQAEEKLTKENADVTHLEGLSLQRMLAKLQGNLDEKMEKERREAVVAKLQFDRASLDLQRIDGSICDIQSQITESRKESSCLANLLQEKQAILIEQGGETGAKLAELEAQLGGLLAMLEEIHEAKRAGCRARGTLGEMEQQLESAESLGVWDMFGGGMLVTMAKHDHMDEAQELSGKLSRELTEFRTELADVSVSISAPTVSISSLSRAGDYLFDGFFMDYHVQTKIGNAQEDTYQTKCKIDTAMEQLEKLERNTLADIQVAEDKRSQLLGE